MAAAVVRRYGNRFLASVARRLNETASRFFMPGWRLGEVLDHVLPQLPGQKVMRVSAFPVGISCHARSEAFDPCWDAAQLRAFIDSFSVEAALHVFLRQDADQLCFRAVFADGSAVVKAGWG
jgi:hypothetical protein